jgi:hypothetical protein
VSALARVKAAEVRFPDTEMVMIRAADRDALVLIAEAAVDRERAFDAPPSDDMDARDEVLQELDDKLRETLDAAGLLA